MSKPYRPCVVAVIQNAEGLVLAGERADRPGAWQLPQGGIDAGESAKIAVLREAREEIGCDQLDILRESETWIRYDFPPEFATGRMKEWAGQEQKWFLMRFQAGGEHCLAEADGEFSAVRWVPLDELVAGIVGWKKEAYAEGLKALGLI